MSVAELGVVTPEVELADATMSGGGATTDVVQGVKVMSVG